MYRTLTKGFSPGRPISDAKSGKSVVRTSEVVNGDLDGIKVVGTEVVGSTLGRVDGKLEGLCDGYCAEGVKVGVEDGVE